MALGMGLLMGSSCTVISPLTATSNPLGSKVGTSMAMSFAGFWIKSDYSIQTAAKNAGIKKISTVDVKEVNYYAIGLIFRETIVTGE